MNIPTAFSVPAPVVVAIPQTPIIPPTPDPSLPGTVMKNLPHFLWMFSVACASFAPWFQKSVADDPAVIESFGSLAAIPTWIAGFGAVASAIGGMFTTLSNQNKGDQAVQKVQEHAEVTKQILDQHVDSLGIAIDDAAKAPAMVPTGQNAVKFRTRLAMNEALTSNQLEDFDVLYAAFKQLKGGPKS